MEEKNSENLQSEPAVHESNNKDKPDKIKTFLTTNKKFVLICVLTLVVVSLLGSTVYVVDLKSKNAATVPEVTKTQSVAPTVTSTVIPTATSVLKVTPTPVVSPTPTVTPAPTSEPVDSTKGAIRIKLLDYDSKQPLPDVSNVNTLIKSGDFSSTKSGAEVYFYNLSVGQTYEVYVDNPPGYTHRASICGSDCQAFGGQQCIRRLPAKLPSENQEIQCLYSKN